MKPSTLKRCAGIEKEGGTNISQHIRHIMRDSHVCWAHN